MDSGVDLIVRISSAAATSADEAWAAISALIPADWKTEDDSPYQRLSREARRAPVTNTGVSFRVTSAVPGFEEAIEALLHSLERRHILVRRLQPDATFECFLRLVGQASVSVEIAPALSQKAAELGVDLILVPQDQPRGR